MKQATWTCVRLPTGGVAFRPPTIGRGPAHDGVMDACDAEHFLDDQPVVLRDQRQQGLFERRHLSHRLQKPDACQRSRPTGSTPCDSPFDACAGRIPIAEFVRDEKRSRRLRYMAHHNQSPRVLEHKGNILVRVPAVKFLFVLCSQCKSAEQVWLTAKLNGGGARNAAIAKHRAVGEFGVTAPELFGCPGAGSGEALAPPDLVQPRTIARETGEQDLAGYPKPTGNPDFDGVLFGQDSIPRREAFRRRICTGQKILTHDT